MENDVKSIKSTEVDHLSRTFDLADPEVQTPKCSSYIAFLKWYKLKVMEPEISENFEKMSSFFSVSDQF